MTTLKIALLFSMLFQLGATILAISLIRRTRFNISWILISSALILMVIRRLFDFSVLFWETKLFPNEEFNNWTAVLISVLLFVGVIFIKKIFNLQDQIDQLRQENENKVLSAIITTEEKAKEMVAKELHDGMGPVLSTIKMTLSAINRENLTPINNRIIESAYTAASNSIVTLKEIANNLSPHLLKNYGLNRAIQTLATQLFSSKPISCEFDFNINDKHLSEEMKIGLYRIISELMNNSLLHANPEKIYLELYQKNDILQLRYMDDGDGFDNDLIKEGKNAGRGLDNIYSRTKSLNGKLEISTAPGLGFSVEFYFPLNKNKNEKN